MLYVNCMFHFFGVHTATLPNPVSSKWYKFFLELFFNLVQTYLSSNKNYLTIYLPTMNNKYFFAPRFLTENQDYFTSFLPWYGGKKDRGIPILKSGHRKQYLFQQLRERIVELCEAESPFTNGEVELDENYFGARRVRGIRGRGVKGKIPVFGMLKRGDNVYT